MSSLDIRDNPCSSASSTARDAAELALWRMMSFYEVPLADLDRAIVADSGWALPHVMKAGFLLSLTEPGMREQAAGHLSDARARSGSATPRERAHLEAVQQVLEGRWHSACCAWDKLLLEHPRDALALQWVQSWDFYRGDAASMRLRPARALPEWNDQDPLYPYVLALHAFGLEENNLYPQAEEAGRRALAANPRVPMAMHAVAHVMEMQGRYDEGAAWLRHQQPEWAQGNGLAGHLWWHKALFRLEGLDTAGVLRIIDSHLSGAALKVTLHRIDAVSMLWRLHLLGMDVSAQCKAVLTRWDMSPAAAGFYSFNDVHVVVALIGAGDVAQAESWVARCAERAMAPEEARRSNHTVAREVGLPLMRGLLALSRGDADSAAEILFEVRRAARSLGGSHAQRDLIDQTLMAAAARGGRRALGRALINERVMAKPVTPLTRHWIEELGLPELARA